MPGTEYGLNELFLPEPHSGKRRSTRISHAVSITVHGTDALGETFVEQTKTVTVSCHGCKFHCSRYVPKHSLLTLEIPRAERASSPRVILGKVVWVQKPSSIHELVQIALVFDVPGNFWSIELPPQDWLPYTVEEKPAVAETSYEPAPGQASASVPLTFLAASAPEPVERPVTLPPLVHPPPVVEAASQGMSSNSSRNMPSGQSGSLQSSELVIASHVSKMIGETRKALDDSLRAGVQTTTDELMRIVGQQVSLQLRPAVEKEVISLMHRISAPAGNEAFARVSHLLALVEQEVRKACEAIAGRIDEPANRIGSSREPVKPPGAASRRPRKRSNPPRRR